MMLASYLRYVMRRKNAFHIHSPFVYALYTKVILGGQPEALKTLGIERTEPVKEGEIPVCDHSVMYVMEDNHKNKKKEAFWNTICSHPDVTLTIDLYDKGMVFYREGMEKQHFVLKK